MECYGNAVPSANMSCLSQALTYDNLNRLTSGGDSFYQNGSGAGYSRSFQYDEYGNMSVTANSGDTLSGLTPMSSQIPFNSANNQLKEANYDARGDTLKLGAVTMAYDGENRQTQTIDTGTNQTINYLYDAAGQRVQKQIAGGTTTVYVHDAFGKLAAEYSSAGVSPGCKTCYLSYDQLGSIRLITDSAGNIVGRHDFLPFGEEMSGGSGSRNGNSFGNNDNVTQMFTGQERDGGTATLDYFNARHFSAVVGSFMEPDPGNAGADILRPQSWNAYAYVLGNLLAMTDPQRNGPLEMWTGWVVGRGVLGWK